MASSVHPALAPRRKRLLLLAALLLPALLLSARSAHAAPLEPLPCDPTNGAASRCLVAEPFIVERLSLRAAGDGLLFAMAMGPGEPQLRVLDAATLTTHGVLPMGDAPLLFSDHHLYTARTTPITATAPLQLALNVAAADRPALLGGYAVDGAAIDWAVGEKALYAISASPGITGTALNTLSLQEPAHPQLVATLPGLNRTRLLRQGNILFAADASGVTVLDLTNPLNPTVLSSTQLFTATQLSDVDLAAAGGYLYFMARSVADGAALCRTLDVRAATGPLVIGDCPFIPGKTVFTRTFAYVNPNQSAAEYLDYAIFSLAEPSAPRLIGSTQQRWVTALVLADGLAIQTAAGHIARLRQTGDGSLTTAVSTWSRDALGLDGTPRAALGDVALYDRGTIGEGGSRLLNLVDIALRTAPKPIGTLSSNWIGAHNLALNGQLLFALHRDRLTLFDLRKPAQPVQLGQFASPLDDSLDHMVLADRSFAFLVSDHNTLLAVDCSTPTTPTLAALVDLPGRTQQVAWANRTLYLYGDDALLVVDVAQPDRPVLVRTIPTQPPEALATWGTALYLLDAGALQVLDLGEPLAPRPAHRIEPPAGMLFVTLSDAYNGRIALQARRATGSAAKPAVIVYDLADPLAPVAISFLVGDYDESWFDGTRLILPGGDTVEIGPRERFTAPLAAANAVQSVNPGGALPPGVTITYTIGPLAGAPAAVNSTASVSPTAACLQHENDPTRNWPLLGESTYVGPFIVRTVDCTTGEPLPLNAPLTLTVALPNEAAAPYRWPDATLQIDQGDQWLPVPDAQRRGAEWRAVIQPP